MADATVVRCERCHRVLNDPVSISLGIGPECRNGSSSGGRKSKRGARFSASPQPTENRNYSVMEFHEVANIFPLMDGESFKDLCTDIASNGLIEPIWVWQGKIIDGRNRYRACVEIGIEPEYREWKGAEEGLLAFVLALNLKRRHLTASQRAAVAVDVEAMLAKQAKERQGERTDLFQKIEKSEPIHAAKQAAHMLGTNTQYVVDAKKLKEQDPGVFEQVLAGNVTLTEAKKSFNYKRDTKSASPQDIYTPQGMDACQTPAYAIDPLLHYLTSFKTIWEPACGEGLLVDALLDCGPNRFSVVGSDIVEGKNFFDFEPEQWDCLVTNPPYSIKFQWLARCYTLGKPFALLMPVETLGAKTAQDLFERYGVEVMLLDKRINFKMPVKGWSAGGAQFPTAWFTWKLGLPSQITFGKVKYE